jgi:hypothetical protein
MYVKWNLTMYQERKCTECGVKLTEKHVMKIKFEDNSWESIPLTICPKCFKKQMYNIAKKTKHKSI